MNRAQKPVTVEVVAARMKLLARQHRVAHLQALIHRQPAGSFRRHALAALLRHEMAKRPGKTDRIA
jgi:hypothetical protein